MSDCIEWQRGKSSAGYGAVWMWGKMQIVPRLVYRLFNDLDEEQMPPVVRHTCDNPACYNVEHLIGGTQKDNIRDCVERGRHPEAAKTHCPRGHTYSGDNLGVSKRQRYCRECKRLSNLKRDRRKEK